MERELCASVPILHMFVRFSQSPSPPSPLSPVSGNPWLNMTVSELVNSNGRRNTSTGGIAMTTQKRRSDWCGRAPLRSPGRPPAARRENYQRFWASIAAGRSSEDAAIDAGVSPAVGGRWFRRAGGMPPLHFSQSSKPLSGRYLSFAEREEIAILRVQGAWSLRDCPQAWAGPFDDLARAAPECRDTQRRTGISGHHRAMAC